MRSCAFPVAAAFGTRGRVTRCALDRRFADCTHPVQLSEGNALTTMKGASRPFRNAEFGRRQGVIVHNRVRSSRVAA